MQYHQFSTVLSSSAIITVWSLPQDFNLAPDPSHPSHCTGFLSSIQTPTLCDSVAQNCLGQQRLTVPLWCNFPERALQTTALQTSPVTLGTAMTLFKWHLIQMTPFQIRPYYFFHQGPHYLHKKKHMQIYPLYYHLFKRYIYQAVVWKEGNWTLRN